MALPPFEAGGATTSLNPPANGRRLRMVGLPGARVVDAAAVKFNVVVYRVALA
jgi:hypothetical protein